MSLVLNTNIASMNAQRNLATTQNQQATTFERLSTGLRVNSAKDDAAGLYLAQSQTKDIRGLNMATRNANDGISMAQTAEGALDQIGQNLQRINELAIQSANGTYNDVAREGLQKEVDELTQEINRIYETTEFNGQPLLNKDAAATILQIGFNNDLNSRIETGLEGGLRKLEGLDEITFLGSSKTFPEGADLTNSSVAAELGSVLGFVDDDGDALTAASAEANASLSGAQMGADLTNRVDMALKNIQGDFDTIGAAMINKAGGTDATGSFTFSANGMNFTLEFNTGATPDGDNASVTGLSATYEGATITFSDGGAAGTPIGELDFRNGDSIADADAGAGDLTEIYGEITNTLNMTASNALNAIFQGDLSQQNAVDIRTQEAAQAAITQSRNAIDMVSEIRATFGAVMNRFEAVISGNQIYAENLSAARSRIQDADFAVETSNLAKQQVLQQAGISSLSQANASSQAILGLLG